MNRIIILFIASSLVTGLSAQVKMPSGYMDRVVEQLNAQWPNNRAVNMVFHGHSVPTGYFVTPEVQFFEAYPIQSVRQIKSSYPYSVINTIVTSIGGENSVGGARRFSTDVLCMKPDVVFIDYSLNDRFIGLEDAHKYWSVMIEKAINYGCKVVLLTPTPDLGENILDDQASLSKHATQVRELANRYGVALVDSYEAFRQIAEEKGSVADYMSSSNHPNEKGHIVVRDLIATLFCK